MGSPEPDTLNDVIAFARAIVQTEIAAKVPGLSITVSVNGDEIWSEEFGFADLAKRTPVTRTTRFRIGSVSKPLTAAGLALLVERGQLDLDAAVQQYIPDYPKKTGVITPRLLAGHLSGIRNYRGMEAICKQPYSSLREGLKVFENDHLESRPGTKFSYSSYNWNVLGVVMEAAARQEFLQYMANHVTKPLGLRNTLADEGFASGPQRAQFYETGPDGKFLVAPTVNLSNRWPSGGYLSTTDDLARFGAAHWQPGFLKSESLKMLFTSQTTVTGTPTQYGLGWFVEPEIILHGGDSLGGTAILLLLPTDRILVAIATNGGQGLLANAMRRGKVPKESERFFFNKRAIASRIAKLFVPLFGN